MIAFAKKFGEDLGFSTYVDHVGNVIIKKPATPGMEDRKNGYPAKSLGHGASKKMQTRISILQRKEFSLTSMVIG